MSGNITVSITWGNDHDLEVDCDVTPYSPAVTFGPPENCCPQEGVDIEILSINLIRSIEKIEEGNRYLIKTICKYHRRKLPQALVEKLADNGEFIEAIENAIAEYDR